MKPKEDPADKAARLRERRMTEIERRKSSEDFASGLTSDLRAIYGMTGIQRIAGNSTFKPPIPKAVEPRSGGDRG